VWHFNFTVGISVPALSKYFKPDGEHGVDFPIVVVPAHLLSPGKKYFNFALDSGTSHERLRNDVLSYFDQHVAPFLNAHKVTSSVFSEANLDFRKSLFVISENQAVGIKAALLANSGKLHEAKEMLRNEIRLRPDFPPKHRESLKCVLRRIESLAE